MTASLERRLSDRWTLGGALGSTVAGLIDLQGNPFDVSPGPVVAATASFRPLDEGTVAPFVLLTGAVTASLSWTAPSGGGPSSPLTAFDVRVGALAGKTIAQVVTPYLLARVFGGPVLASLAGQSYVGTDAYHYQLGGGVSVHAGRVDVLVEGVPLGERGVVAGVGVAF